MQPCFTGFYGAIERGEIMGEISKEAKRERATYMREYRRLHPEKTREINHRYWQKKAEQREAKQNAENAETDK